MYIESVSSHLHQASASASVLWKLCDDASNTVLIENNGVAPEWGCSQFLSDSHCFQWEQYMASVIAELSQRRCWRLV